MSAQRTRVGRLISGFVCVLLAAAVAVVAPPVQLDSASAADLSKFQAGNIVSDAVFYDSAAMTEAEVDAFLRSKVSTCQSGFTCLKDYRETTTSRAADRYCNAYAGGQNESAARIVVKVAQACGINPQALLVILQKEQGLVTHTNPSSWRYTIAMGQGCPDTADCDTRYHGFFNQLYGAARQFQIYAEGVYFTYYAPGRTWNILFNPNSACGTAPVYVANKATAGLYYYTPYQPNRAALAAGYGEGDGCSSYGNRNFYQYFTDWFGSTQQSATRLLRAEGNNPAVYLVSNGTRYHIQTYEDLLAYQSRLGGMVQVSPTYIDRFPAGGPLSRYVHDTRTGTLYLLEADGTRHRFDTPDQVRLFGYEFGSYVNLEHGIIDRFTRGADVNSSFVRIGANSAVFHYDGTALRHVPTMEIWRLLAGSAPLYAASMDPLPASKIARGTAVLPIGTLVRESSRPEVYVVGSATALAYVDNLAVPGDLGIRDSHVVPPSTFDGYTRSDSAIAPIVSCGSDTYVASAGTPLRVTGTTSSLRPFTLSSAPCPAWAQAATTAAPVFVSVAGDGAVYEVVDGVLRHVLRYEDLVARNGNRPLVLMKWSVASAKVVGYGAPLLVDGQFARFTDSGMVYIVRDGALRHVTSYPQLLALAGGRTPTIIDVPPSARSQLTIGPALEPQ